MPGQRYCMTAAGTAALAAALLLSACSQTSHGFATQSVAFCGPAKVSRLVVADFSGDGADDVAVGCRTRQEPHAGSVELWLSDGNGKLHRAQQIKLGTLKTGGGSADVVTAGDFNADGHLDLVVLDSQGTEHRHAILYGRDDGGFGEPEYFSRPVTWAAASDVDSDGHQDLVIALNKRSKYYLAGNGGKLDTGAHKRNMAPRSRNVESSTAEINGDGLADAILRLPHSHALLVYPSGGQRQKIQLDKSHIRLDRVLSGARIDGDDATDLFALTTNDKHEKTVRVLFTQGGAHWSAPLPVPLDNYYGFSAQAGDFNGDGRPDLLIRSSQEDHRAHLLFLTGQAGGGFQRGKHFKLPGSWNGITVGDFNADGKTDFVYQRISKDEDQGIVYLNQQ